MRRFAWSRRIAAGLSLFLFIGHAQAPTAKTPAPTAVPSTAAPTTQTAGVNPATATPTPAHTLDQADLTAFFDGILPLQLERSDIAGASVLVMKDGNVLLAKGYGYADVKKKKPVDPASTIFRLASISKLFTWISVMQLEEQGKLESRHRRQSIPRLPDSTCVQQADYPAQPDDPYRRL